MLSIPWQWIFVASSLLFVVPIMCGGFVISPRLEVIKNEYSLRLKIKHNDWLLADTCPQAANH